jgi:hypothetical protein
MCYTSSDAVSMPKRTLRYSKVWNMQTSLALKERRWMFTIDESLVSSVPTFATRTGCTLRVTSVSKNHFCPKYTDSSECKYPPMHPVHFCSTEQYPGNCGIFASCTTRSDLSHIVCARRFLSAILGLLPNFPVLGIVAVITVVAAVVVSSSCDKDARRRQPCAAPSIIETITIRLSRA